MTPLDLLKFKPLSLPNRVRLGLTTLYLQRQKDWQKYERVTAEEWLRRHGGQGVYDVFWGPMLRGKFGEDYYRQVSMAWVWGKINTRVKSRGKSMVRENLGYPLGSFGMVFDTLVEKIREQGGEVHTSTPVNRILIEDGRATGLEIRIGDGGLREEKFDAVLATTPSPIFSRLVPPMPDEYRSRLERARYMSAVLIVLVLDRPLSHVYWLNVADRSIPFVGVIEHTNLIGPEHYGGKHIVYLSNYLTTDDPLYRMGHDELLDEYLPHLKKINPGLRAGLDRDELPPPGRRRPAGDRRGLLPAHTGPPDPVQGRVPGEHDSDLPGGPGTNYSVRMGRQVAKRILNSA